jgi:sugar-specific transcriptional regulator TrmB
MDLLASLVAIGFTEYEAKTYLALLREHPATGYRVSKAAGIPRSMVYEALGRLHARGAVLETSDGRATQYRPLPPEVLLDQQEQEHRRRMTDLREGLQRLYAAQEDERVWSISQRRSVLSYAVQMIRQAQNEIYLVLADPDLQALYEHIGRACEKGVSVNTLLTGDAELDCGQTARHSRLESKLQELTGTLMVVVDGREVLVANSDTETRATITHNANLVMIARQFVWMELFAQRVYRRLGPDLLTRLDPVDRRVFESLGTRKGNASP